MIETALQKPAQNPCSAYSPLVEPHRNQQKRGRNQEDRSDHRKPPKVGVVSEVVVLQPVTEFAEVRSTAECRIKLFVDFKV